MPFSIPFFELKLHEMASNGGDEHVARLTSNGVVELENLVVARTTFTNSKALVPREYGGHRFRHRWLLCYIEDGNRTGAGHGYCTARVRATALGFWGALDEMAGMNELGLLSFLFSIKVLFSFSMFKNPLFIYLFIYTYIHTYINNNNNNNR